MTSPTWSKGQEVRVFARNAKKLGGGHPEGGWPGVVVKLGPKFVTAQYNGTTQTFHVDGGTSTDAYSQYLLKSLEQIEHEERTALALAVLERHGFSADPQRRHIPLTTIEAVAALLESLQPEPAAGESES